MHTLEPSQAKEVISIHAPHTGRDHVTSFRLP